MTETTAPVRPLPQRIAVSVVALGLAAPLLFALGFVGLMAAGPVGMVAPVVAVLVPAIYRAVVRSAHSVQTRVAVREVGAVVLSPVLGFALWVIAMVVGVATEVLPFLMEDGTAYPYEDVWMAGSVAVAVLSVPLWWWLLRRWADPSLRTR